MKIDVIVERYLVLEGRQEDFDKWVKVVKSCKTTDQLNSAINMGQNLYVKYGETFLAKIIDSPFYTPFLNKLEKIVVDKQEKLSHEDEQKLLKWN